MKEGGRQNEIAKLCALTEVVRTEAGSCVAIALAPLRHDVAARPEPHPDTGQLRG